MNIRQFLEHTDKLELIDSFETYSLYYDRSDKSIWFWDGKSFVGIDISDISDIYEISNPKEVQICSENGKKKIRPDFVN